jgi:Mg2+ and Co2+ transporter CorA
VNQNSRQEALDKILVEDIDFLSTQIGEHHQALEPMMPMLSSMVQLMESRRAIEETVYVKRLTHIALFFLPLSFVSCLLSMNEGFAINTSTSGFKVYLVTALPLLVVVLTVSNFP